MAIYAILDNKTNIVKNITISNDINFVFSSEEEYVVLGNKAVQIGMLYNKKTKTFPEIGDKGELLDLRDEIQVLINNHQNLLLENTHLIPEQLIPHNEYISNLYSIMNLESYIEMKSQYNLVGNAPEIPSPPKLIYEQDFRGQLKVTEKILWDNPEIGNAQQKALINTMKLDFPFSGIESIRDELDLLETTEVIGVGRAEEIYNLL